MREFQVTKDDGTHWLVQYTSEGVRWIRVMWRDSRGDSEDAPSPRSNRRLIISKDPVSILTNVVDVASRVGMMLEARHANMLNAAVHDERRLEWLSDMLARWSATHTEGGELDLRLSDYLAREALETLKAVLGSRGGKAAIPQSILFEVDLIMDVFRTFRVLISQQFEALFQHPEIDINAAVREVLPGRGIDRELVRLLGRDPSMRWAERLRGKAKGKFDEDLAESFRHPDVFLEKLLPSVEVTLAKPVTELEPAERPGVITRVLAALQQALPREEEFLSAPTDRADAFRELALLTAEVARLKALNSAWVTVVSFVENYTGNHLVVTIDVDGPSVQLMDPRAIPELLMPVDDSGSSPEIAKT